MAVDFCQRWLAMSGLHWIHADGARGNDNGDRSAIVPEMFLGMINSHHSSPIRLSGEEVARIEIPPRHAFADSFDGVMSWADSSEIALAETTILG